MFVSFFPSPRPFFISVVVWTAIVCASWYLGGYTLGTFIGLPPEAPDAAPVIGGQSVLHSVVPLVLCLLHGGGPAVPPVLAGACPKSLGKLVESSAPP